MSFMLSLYTPERVVNALRMGAVILMVMLCREHLIPEHVNVLS